MAESNANNVKATFQVEGLSDELRVLSFEGDEGISVPFQINLVLACSSAQLSLSDVVGKKGALTLTGQQGDRYLHGLVSHFQQQDSGRKFTIYEATVVPAIWRLLHTQDSRIFQEMNIKQIISKVLGERQIDFKFQTKGNQDPPTREYCVQYRESDWAFICRLLEEEGFFYFFEHKRDKHVLQIGNDVHFHPDISSPATVPFHVPDSRVAAKEHIFRMYFSEAVRSGKAALSDFNFKKPSLSLLGEQKGDLDGDLELYDYPGLYDVPEVGKGLAKVRLEEAQMDRQHALGESNCSRLGAGQTFTLSDHIRKAANDVEYLLTRIHHLGERGSMDLDAGALDQRMSYSNTFRSIPAKVPFRPPRVTRKPHVQGVQTAIVVGPAGEEIYTDEHARVKVQFHWDREGKRDAKSSCWIRVSQLWAGQGWGAVWIPRIGHEVIVDFIEGDPDRPIITGRVYHAQNVPPYSLPDDKTKSTIKSDSTIGGGGSNELRFDDKKDAEEFYTHAQKDQNEVIENDMSTTVGRAQAVSVGAAQTITVGKNRERTVGGDESIKVEGERTETVDKDETVTIMLNRTTNVKMKEKLDAGQKIELICGASKITMNMAGMITIEGVKADLKMSGPVSIKGIKIGLN